MEGYGFCSRTLTFHFGYKKCLLLFRKNAVCLDLATNHILERGNIIRLCLQSNQEGFHCPQSRIIVQTIVTQNFIKSFQFSKREKGKDEQTVKFVFMLLVRIWIFVYLVPFTH